jgi:hypothetical protein
MCDICEYITYLFIRIAYYCKTINHCFIKIGKQNKKNNGKKNS